MMTKEHDFKKELDFLKVAENLKKELRHSWLSDERRESVAEHSWRLCLMAFRYAGRLHRGLDVNRCIKIALVHDLAEAIVGDVHVFDSQTVQAKRIKEEAEYIGIKKIQALLNDPEGDELFSYWEEYEDQKSDESRFIKALDKLEVFIQHMEADLHTWEEREKRMFFQDKWLKHYCAWDPFLLSFAEAVLEKGIAKLRAGGENIARIKKEAAVEELQWLPCEEEASCS